MESKNLSYEEALAQIETIVDKFRKGNMSVDQLAEEVKKATELISYCKAKLIKAEKDLSIHNS